MLQKTKATMMNTSNSQPIEIDGTAVDYAKHLIHLGATVSDTGGTNEDIHRILGHARLAYNKLSLYETIANLIEKLRRNFSNRTFYRFYYIAATPGR